MKIVNTDGNSVLIDTDLGLYVWMDVIEEDGEFFADWNKYIFFLDRSEDVEIKEFQENVENFELCSSLAIEYFENKGEK